LAQTTTDRKAEADRLLQQGNEQYQNGRFAEVVQSMQQALTIYREIGDRTGESLTLKNLGLVYSRLGDYSRSLDYYQQALVINQQIGDKAGEATVLNSLGSVYSNLGEYSRSLEYYQQALPLNQAVGDKLGEATILRNIGEVYRLLGEYPQAIKFLQEALTLRLEIKDRAGEGSILGSIGAVYRDLGQYERAFEFLKKALSISREIRSRSGEGAILNNLGLVLFNQGQYQQALKLFQEAAQISTAIQPGLADGEGTNLSNAKEAYWNIGAVYAKLNQYEQTLKSYQRALEIVRQISDRAGEANALNNLGTVYEKLGKYDQARESYEQALAIFRKIPDQTGEGNTLNNLGELHRQLSQYSQALELLNQSLKIFKELDNRKGIGATLNNIGLVHDELGQHSQALEFYQQSLKVRQEINARTGVGTTLHNIGLVYDQLGQDSKALEFYQQALAVRQEVVDKVGEGTTLNNLGLVHNRLGQNTQALQSLEKALSIFRELGYPLSEGNTLDSLGTLYKNFNQYTQAFESYQQALAISREVGNRALERVTLSHIGDLLAEQNQRELAIIFYKQSVNVTEGIRQNLQTLPREQQLSYIQTVTKTYRRLADLLLQQDRVLEAQQVLELLKVQELDNYLQQVRGNNQPSQGSDLQPQERQFVESFNQLQDQAIQIGKQLRQLRQIPVSERTEQHKQQITYLEAAQQEILRQFNAFIESDEVEALAGQLNQRAREWKPQLSNLNTLKDNLLRLEQNAVLVYPLILDDRLELVLLTPYAPPIHRSVSVKRQDLNQAIVNFRRALQDPTTDAKLPARQLYDWLIKPIEADLKNAEAQTLIYIPDNQLRYIPLAALYDGNQWLVERFRVNNITAASLTDLNTRPKQNLQVLAAAFTQGHYRFQVGSYWFDFAGLPFADVEVKNLASLIPSTTQLLDKAFTPQATISQMDDYTIVHLATHAAFIPGQPNDSFILFGDGSRVTLSEVKNWSLTNVDLIVLSACETAVGGELNNGDEIQGFGYLMEKAGARAAIASLWSVNDGGTQALMNAFYAHLQSGNLTKAEALRQAQIALIAGKGTVQAQDRGLGIVPVSRDNTQLRADVNRLTHPFYWAAFILIGNGL
jgi:CHAT domain-containing protein/Tfp pilus assembly protein PilF